VLLYFQSPYWSGCHIFFPFAKMVAKY
jgi:hypothetical protein